MTISAASLKNLEFNSDYPIDKIMQLYEGSESVSGTSVETDTFTNNWGDYVGIDGVFEVDGISGYATFGASIQVGSSGGSPLLGTVTAYCDQSTIYIQIENGDSSTNSFNYKFVVYSIE